MKQKLKIILLFFIATMFLGGCNMQNRFLYFPSAKWLQSKCLRMKIWTLAGDGIWLSGIDRRPWFVRTQWYDCSFHADGARRSTEGLFRAFYKTGFPRNLSWISEIRKPPGKVGEKPFVAPVWKRCGMRWAIWSAALSCGRVAGLRRCCGCC